MAVPLLDFFPCSSNRAEQGKTYANSKTSRCALRDLESCDDEFCAMNCFDMGGH